MNEIKSVNHFFKIYTMMVPWHQVISLGSILCIAHGGCANNLSESEGNRTDTIINTTFNTSAFLIKDDTDSSHKVNITFLDSVQLIPYKHAIQKDDKNTETVYKHLLVPRETIMIKVLRKATKMFKELPNVVHLPQENANETIVIVCGDIHGQLDDVIGIFNTFGWPSSNRCYLFNGDLVDRGPQSLMVLYMLLRIKCSCRGCLYINRGNHEGFKHNRKLSKSGFNAIEIETNYPKPKAKKLFKAANKLFRHLPLCSILWNRTMVVHGGIPKHSNNSSQINGLKVYKDAPIVLLSEINALNRSLITDTRVHNETLYKSQIGVDMLWSDPNPNISIPANKNGTFVFNNKRSISHMFDCAAIAKFLTCNNLSLLIRSHQVKRNGFQSDCDDRCITIFSASIYGGNQTLYNNTGAIASIFDNHTTVTTFYKKVPVANITFSECRDLLKNHCYIGNKSGIY